MGAWLYLEANGRKKDNWGHRDVLRRLGWGCFAVVIDALKEEVQVGMRGEDCRVRQTTNTLGLRITWIR